MRPPFPIPTPKTISELVIRACKQVVRDPLPVHIPVRLEMYSQPDNCHVNAAEKVRRDGGAKCCGWVVWEVPDWEIRIEFHSVWKSPKGELVDVSEPVHGGNEVLFVPDPVRTYNGLNIPSVHFPYNDNRICHEFVEIAAAIEALICHRACPRLPATNRLPPK